MLINVVMMLLTVIAVGFICLVIRKTKKTRIKYSIAGLVLILMPNAFHIKLFPDDRIYFALSLLAVVIGVFLFIADIPKARE